MTKREKKTELIALRLGPSELDRLNAWRRTQMDPPSKAEAVRALMELGLEAAERAAGKGKPGKAP